MREVFHKIMHDRIEPRTTRELRLISLIVALTAVIIIGMSLTLIYFYGEIRLTEQNKQLLIAELAILGFAFGALAALIWRTASHLAE